MENDSLIVNLSILESSHDVIGFDVDSSLYEIVDKVQSFSIENNIRLSFEMADSISDFILIGTLYEFDTTDTGMGIVKNVVPIMDTVRLSE